MKLRKIAASKQCELIVRPAFLFCRMNNFALSKPPDEQGRCGVVELHISHDVFSVVIRVAVFTEVSAGVVCADVRSENAETLRSLRFSFRHVKPTANHRFKRLLRHVAAAVHPVRYKLFALRTRFYRDTVTDADLGKRRSERDTLVSRHGACLRKIPLYIFVKVDKADDAHACIFRKCFAHLLEIGNVTFCRL